MKIRQERDKKVRVVLFLLHLSVAVTSLLHLVGRGFQKLCWMPIAHWTLPSRNPEDEIGKTDKMILTPASELIASGVLPFGWRVSFENHLVCL